MNYKNVRVIENEDNLAGLLARVGSGDTIAFDALYRATVALVTAIARAGCASHAEDIVAETYLQIWRTAGTFDASRCSVRGWMAMIARSRCMDILRRDFYRHDGEMHRSSVELDDLPQLDQKPIEEAAWQAQSVVLLHAALNELQAKERQLLTLFYFHALTHAEISNSASMPLGTVKTVIRRSLQRLRGAFGIAATTLVA